VGVGGAGVGGAGVDEGMTGWLLTTLTTITDMIPHMSSRMKHSVSLSVMAPRMKLRNTLLARPSSESSSLTVEYMFFICSVCPCSLTAVSVPKTCTRSVK
jgi:hypothetical protein